MQDSTILKAAALKSALNRSRLVAVNQKMLLNSDRYCFTYSSASCVLPMPPDLESTTTGDVASRRHCCRFSTSADRPTNQVLDSGRLASISSGVPSTNLHMSVSVRNVLGSTGSCK
jgi:hypothetical protein